MFPRVLIDLKKVEENSKIAVDICKEKNIDIMTVTKVFCGITKIIEAQIKGGIKYLADSRIENLEKAIEFNLEKVLLRLPMISESDRVVTFSDISLNSEIETIKALDKSCKKLNRKHKIILMIDLGDLREGILKKDLYITVDEILKLENILLHGVGVNLTCFAGVIPDENNLGELVEIYKQIEERYNLKLEIISGGNSSSFHLIDSNRLPKEINNLRMGEVLVLGREAAYGNSIKNMHDDAFILEAEIIELKEKNSIPTGTIGMNAFGEKPVFEDKGIIKRGILAIGVQDVIPNKLFPFDSDLEFLGSSSDHMIWNFTDSKKEYKVGDTVKFKLEYSAMLQLFTSSYVSKEYI